MTVGPQLRRRDDRTRRGVVVVIAAAMFGGILGSYIGGELSSQRDNERLVSRVASAGFLDCKRGVAFERGARDLYILVANATDTPAVASVLRERARQPIADNCAVYLVDMSPEHREAALIAAERLYRP